MEEVQSAIVIDEEADRRAASARAVQTYLQIQARQFTSVLEAQSGIEGIEFPLFVLDLAALDNHALTTLSPDDTQRPVIVTTCRNAYEVMEQYPRTHRRPSYWHCPVYNTGLNHHQKIRSGLDELGIRRLKLIIS